jgi:Winged helix DNA-binding domain
MKLEDVSRLRMQNQHLYENSFKHPDDVVSWFGAMQAQDYSAAKWAVSLRSKNLSNSSLDQYFGEGKILRTHVLRPTWHFVTPADIRWMLQLTTPHICMQVIHWYRSLGLTDEVFTKTDAVLTEALKCSKQLTRSNLAEPLRQSGINVELNNLRLTFIMLHAELEGIICSGALQGKEHTYALLDERVPQTKLLTHDEALAELTERYFRSHGPATVKDYTWWSSLPVADAKHGIEMVGSELRHEKMGGQDYWFFAHEDINQFSIAASYLLPNFDEYIIGYSDRSAIFDVSYASGLDARHNPLFQHTVVMDGRIVGTWKRTIQKTKVIVTVKPFVKLDNSEQECLRKAMMGYGRFMGLPAELVIENASTKPLEN